MLNGESSVIKKAQAARVRMVPVTSNTVTTLELLAESRVLTIRHNNEPYQLRITSNNKLILTK